MKFADILLCFDASDDGRKRSDAGLALAQRSHAYVHGYYLPPRRGVPMEDFLEGPSAEKWETEALEFERQLRLRGLEGTCVPGDVDRNIEGLLGLSSFVDLVVVGLGFPDDPASDPQGLNIERLVIESGRPILDIPAMGLPEKIGRNVLVAWDGSRESTRAVHDAIPFLREAETVKIAAIDADPASPRSPGNLIAHLDRLGIAATVDASFDMQLPIGDELLTRIEENEIDLLVAGAFGHSRLREHLFGGVSARLLHQMMVPILVSH